MKSAHKSVLVLFDIGCHKRGGAGNFTFVKEKILKQVFEMSLFKSEKLGKTQFNMNSSTF